MTDSPPPVDIEPSRPSLWQRASAVWIIPVIALVAALGVAWSSYSARGPLIHITFANGAGIKANETELRYRDVTVGLVEDVDFTPDLLAVVASVRVDKDVAPYIDTSSTFWVVRPEVSARGITGLDTVLTGVFIEGTWDGERGPRREEFNGLSEAPLYRPGSGGLQIALRSTPGGRLTDEVPILFRGIEVGQVGAARISPNGQYAIAEALIDEPYGHLITPATRFWDVSGFTFSVGPSGAEIDFTSIGTLVGGGITFDTFVSGGEQVPEGSIFDVYTDVNTARNSVFNATEVAALDVRVVFDDNLAGLAVGAPVELSGLKIGTVQTVNGIVDADAFGDDRVRLNAVLAIQPARLGLQGDVTPETALAFLGNRVRDGVRARLASASLLTGGLKVELVQVDDAPPAEMTQPAEPGALPVLPATEAEVSDAAATLEGMFNRVNSLPIEDLLKSAIDFMDNAKALVSSQEIRETPAEIRGLIGDIREVVQSEDVQKIPVTLNAAVERIEEVVAQIAAEQVAAKLSTALDEAAKAAGNIRTGTAGLNDLVERLNAVAAKANELPLEELTRQVTELVASADAVIDTPGARALPGDLGRALDQLNATLEELREGGAVSSINATLGSVRQAADRVAVGADEIPALVDRLTRLLDQASSTVAGYNRGDVLTRDAQSALRDISQAADALSSLARMIERNPTSLIRGR
ncbi:MlaD family protein [Sulfitobacter sp. LCG007]